MTHDELKAKIFQEYATTYEDLAGNVPMSPKALLAVVELHKPYESAGAGWLCDWCYTCNFERTGLYMDFAMYAYPCPTIQAIEKELS